MPFFCPLMASRCCWMCVSAAPCWSDVFPVPRWSATTTGRSQTSRWCTATSAWRCSLRKLFQSGSSGSSGLDTWVFFTGRFAVCNSPMRTAASLCCPLQADESLDVLHLNYTSWPDHGVPTVNAIESILQFVHIVRQQANRTKDPVTVHCRSVSSCFSCWFWGHVISQVTFQNQGAEKCWTKSGKLNAGGLLSLSLMWGSSIFLHQSKKYPSCLLEQNNLTHIGAFMVINDNKTLETIQSKGKIKHNLFIIYSQLE